MSASMSEAFELQVAMSGRKRATLFFALCTNLQTTIHMGPTASGPAMRVHMIQVLCTSGAQQIPFGVGPCWAIATGMQCQSCVSACALRACLDSSAGAGRVSQNSGSWRPWPAPLSSIALMQRTTWMQGTSVSCPCSCGRRLCLAARYVCIPLVLQCPSSILLQRLPKSRPVLLQPSEAHLGNSLFELYVAMPTLAVCGCEGVRQEESNRNVQASGDAAVAAIGAPISMDMEALRSLVSTRPALAVASR